MRVPAFCKNCGSIFPSSIEMENCKNISFSNCGSGPCPKCGGTSHIPDGVYNFIGDTIELLSGPNRTISELQRLATTLTNLRKQSSSSQQSTQKICDEIPELSSLAEILPKTRSELYAFIPIILMIIQMIVTQLQSGYHKNVVINQVINNVYQQQLYIDQDKGPFVKENKTGRNELCPCGSGKKYKKCCLTQKKSTSPADIIHYF